MKRLSDVMLNRRKLGQASLAAALGTSIPGWFRNLASCAEQARSAGTRRKACILLWMDGGPSHLDTFDPKPDASSDFSGAFDAIDTTVAGIQICERFPAMARQIQHCALLRGMTTEEADHGRARIYMHTGYKPGFGGVSYPSLGSIASAEIGDEGAPVPNFVTTGTPLNKYDFVTDPGYLGPRHAALVHYDPSRQLENLEPLPSETEFRRRERVLREMESQFARDYRSRPAATHQAVFDRAVRLMRSANSQAFDISQEPDSVREAYGDHEFGRGCLLARRLVEAGVTFVEVYSANWDTHEQKSADEASALMPHIDRGMAVLIADLADRGMLDDTLVIWMGEFGRTPRINRNGGRDHYAKAWTTVMAGAGIRGGQAVGRTDRTGADVVDRPVSAIDFMASICQALGIDAKKELNTPIGRPVQLVAKDATPIAELFGS